MPRKSFLGPGRSEISPWHVLNEDIQRKKNFSPGRLRHEGPTRRSRCWAAMSPPLYSYWERVTPLRTMMRQNIARIFLAFHYRAQDTTFIRRTHRIASPRGLAWPLHGREVKEELENLEKLEVIRPVFKPTDRSARIILVPRSECVWTTPRLPKQSNGQASH